MTNRITDEAILKAVDKFGNAEKIMKTLGIKELSTLQKRIGRIQQERGQFIKVQNLFPKPRVGGVRKRPKIGKDGGLWLSNAWLRETGFATGDRFEVKFTKTKITLTKREGE